MALAEDVGRMWLLAKHAKNLKNIGITALYGALSAGVGPA